METMATKRCFYEVLGVEKNADSGAISRAYRKLAIKYHPDSNPNDEEATRLFKEAAEAYEVLNDSQKRAAYDQYGHAAFQGGGPGGAAGAGFDFGDVFEDLFDNFFGGGGRRRGGGRSGKRRGADLKCQVTLTLAEAAKGVSKTVQFDRNEVCVTCRGSGSKPGSTGDTCRRCQGRGQVVQSAGILRVQTTCPDCQGAGKVITDPCSGCRGRGWNGRRVELEVAIPAGVDDDMQVRIQGEGEPSPNGGPPGDCFCFIRIKPHPLFKRDGGDLFVEVPISYTQAALGAIIEIPTIEGPDQLTISPGTQSGEIFRLGGRGMPDPRGGKNGDLLVQTNVEVPKRLGQKEEELLRELAEMEHSNVTPQRKSFLSKLKDIFSPAE